VHYWKRAHEGRAKMGSTPVRLTAKCASHNIKINNSFDYFFPEPGSQEKPKHHKRHFGK
jgi:hypothetical protein